MTKPVDHPMVLGQGLTDESGTQLRQLLERNLAPVLTKTLAPIIPLVITDRGLQSPPLLRPGLDVRGNPVTSSAHGAAEKAAGQMAKLVMEPLRLLSHLLGELNLFVVDGDEQRGLMFGHGPGKLAVHDHGDIRLHPTRTACFLFLRTEQLLQFLLGQRGKMEGQTMDQLLTLAQEALTAYRLHRRQPHLSLEEQRRYPLVPLPFSLLGRMGHLSRMDRLDRCHRIQRAHPLTIEPAPIVTEYWQTLFLPRLQQGAVKKTRLQVKENPGLGAGIPCQGQNGAGQLGPGPHQAGKLPLQKTSGANGLEEKVAIAGKERIGKGGEQIIQPQ